MVVSASLLFIFIQCSAILHREGDKFRRWIPESLWFRRRRSTLNRDEGGYKLSHIQDPLVPQGEDTIGQTTIQWPQQETAPPTDWWCLVLRMTSETRRNVNENYMSIGCVSQKIPELQLLLFSTPCKASRWRYMQNYLHGFKHNLQNTMSTDLN